MEGLLAKDPAARTTWPQLCTSPFWKANLQLRALPEEPLLMKYILRTGPAMRERPSKVRYLSIHGCPMLG